jgi:hypothetical protein
MIPSLPDLPSKKENVEEDEAQLGDYPWVEPPIRLDYGTRVSCVLSVSFERAVLTFSHSFSSAFRLLFPALTLPRSFLLLHPISSLTHSIGKGTFVNFGFIALDTCQITIGARVLFGPNVQLCVPFPFPS